MLHLYLGISTAVFRFGLSLVGSCLEFPVLAGLFELQFVLCWTLDRRVGDLSGFLKVEH